MKKLAALGLVLLPSLSTAQTTTGELENLVVKADAVGNSAQQSNEIKHNAPNAVTVISAEQLNQFGDQPLGDALRRLPGVSFDGANRAREIRLRGIGREYTQVLVNGRPLIDGNSSRSVQVDRIPSSLVDRVEISRAPLSSFDGQGAAGTVNIILKNTDFKPRTELGFGVGYLDHNGAVGDATFFQAGEWGNLKYSLSGGIQRQRRNESQNTTEYDAARNVSAGRINLNERKFNQFNFIPSFELEISPQDTLHFEPSYLWTEEIRNDEDFKLKGNALNLDSFSNELRERTRENVGLYSAWEHRLSDESGKFTFGVDIQIASEETMRDAKNYKGNGDFDYLRNRDQDIDLEYYSATFDYQQTFGDHSFAWGADFSHSTRDEINSSVKTGEANKPDKGRIYNIKEQRWNAYVQDQWQITPETLLTAGLRLEQSSTRTRDYFGINNTNDEFFILPSINLVHSLQENLDLRAGIAKTLRRPDLRDLSPFITDEKGTLAKPDTRGNPHQDPEEIWGIDLGTDYYFYDRKGVISFNAFGRKFDNKIENVLTMEGGRWLSTPQNTGKGDMYGLELDGRAPLDMFNLPQLTLWGNLTWIHTKLDDPLGGRRRFLEQPNTLANLGIDWFVEDINTTFGLSVNFNNGYSQTEKLDTGDRRYTSLDSLARLDFSARTQLSEQLSLSLSVLNLIGSKERLHVRQSDAFGTPTSYSDISEKTYRSAYLKLNYTF